MGTPAVKIDLTDTERADLESLANRRKTAQDLARRTRIVLAAAQGLENKAIAQALGRTRTPSANGAAALPSGGSTAFMMNPGPVRHDRSAMTRSPKRSD